MGLHIKVTELPVFQNVPFTCARRMFFLQGLIDFIHVYR
jgi:hypothetical protein